MSETEYLGLADVLAIHADVMTRMGWVPAPLRDEGALESAIMKPRMAAHYEGADLVRQATLLAVGISQAQAFVDGNKRTAYQALDTFLWINGLELIGDALDLARRLELVAEELNDRETAVDRFEEWLRQHLMPKPA